MLFDKRGLQHVEFVLSFVIFVGFLIFALYFFSPFKESKVVESSLFYTMNEIDKMASVQLETFSVVINDSVNDKTVGIKLNVPEGYNSKAIDSSGNDLESYFDGTNAFVNRNNDRFFTVELSEVFSGNELNGVILDDSNYTISSSDERNVLSEKKFMDIIKRYNSNYDELKKDFNLGDREDFSFSLVFSENDKIVAEKIIPKGLQVFSKTKKFETIRTDGSIAFADLIVRVW